MLLTELLEAAGIAAIAPAVPVLRIVTDSRQCQPGDLFVAMPGTRTDGLQFVPQALAAGAVAAVAGFIALLFKPRELWRACRAHPGRAVGVVAGLVFLCLAVPWVIGLMTPAPAGTGGRPVAAAASPGVSGTDWSKVALEILASRAREGAPTAGVTTPATPAGGDSTADV
ncbi:MAG: Mur ligase domain-containing protein, partial [Pseudanabaenaceae cyanobacterium]